MKYRFSDLADIAKLQELMGSLYWLTDISIGIVEADGDFLFCAGWRSTCSAGQPQTCTCLDYITKHLDPVSYTLKRCPTGMLHYACPIVIEGEHLASVYIGQFFIDPPDTVAIQLEAAKQGIDPVEYQRALLKFSVIPPMRLSLLLKYLKDLANMLAELGLQRLRQMETLELLKLNEERLQYLSSHDPLTGLLNRSCFEEGLKATAMAPELPTTIMICDIDSLKLINDSLGHPAGDRLLQVAANLLRETCPAEAIISRIGGDEFAILLPRTDSTAAQDLHQLIQSRIDCYNNAPTSVLLGLSIGWAVAQTTPFTMRELFSKADAAMYQCKSKNADRIRNRIATKVLKGEYINE